MAQKEKKAQSDEKNDSEMLRRFKSNPLIFIGSFFILILVIVAFVLPSSLGMNSGGRDMDLTFGYYDKIPISHVPGNYFSQYLNSVVQRQQNPLDPENPFAYYSIWREAFEAATGHIAMIREMQKAGYSVPDKIVDREVAGLPQFQENGRFSSTLYKRLDENSRLSLWKQVQESIVKDRYHSDITDLLQPPGESKFIGNMGATRRSFEMVTFSVDSYSDEEYEAFLSENPELFRSVHLSMITVGSGEREAQRILASIKNGETTFEDAARAHSQDPYKERGGDMGIKTAYEVDSDIPEEDARKKALALDRGEYSEVLKISSGWVFFRAEEAAQEADTSDPAILDKVGSYMRNYQPGVMQDRAIGHANDFIAYAQEFDFAEAVSHFNLQTRAFGPIPVNFGSIDLFPTIASQSVEELQGAATDENLWKTAFSTPLHTPSEPLVRGSNILVLYPTEEIEDEEAAGEITTMINAYWMRYMTAMSLQHSILNSPKMEDKFLDMYFRIYMPQGN